MQSICATLVVVVLVAAAFALSSPVSSLVDDIPTDYMPLPGENSYLRNEMYVEVLSKDTRPAGLAPEKMLEDFEERSKSAPSAYERAFAKQMHEVGIKGDGACNGLTHRFVYEIISLAKQHPESPALANYVNFLKTIGKAKFAECATKVPGLYGERIGFTVGMVDRARFVMFERGLDWFFAAYSTKAKLNERPSDDQLYQIAKGADLARADINVDGMFKVAKSYTSERFLDKKPSKIEIFQRFFDNACGYIRLPFELTFDTYNIAAAFGSKLPENMPVRFLKLNEYRRVCLAFGEAEYENLEQRAKTISNGHKWFKFGKN